MGQLKVYDQQSGQFITLNAFPVKQTISFTTITVEGEGDNEEITESGFNNRSLVRKLKVTPTDPTIEAFQVDFYKNSSFAENQLEYRATASGTFVDNDVWFHEDLEASNQLYFKVTNDGTNNSTFSVEITAEAFA
jgi:hypothetical protein